MICFGFSLRKNMSTLDRFRWTAAHDWLEATPIFVLYQSQQAKHHIHNFRSFTDVSVIQFHTTQQKLTVIRSLLQRLADGSLTPAIFVFDSRTGIPSRAHQYSRLRDFLAYEFQCIRQRPIYEFDLVLLQAFPPDASRTIHIDPPVRNPQDQAPSQESCLQRLHADHATAHFCDPSHDGLFAALWTKSMATQITQTTDKFIVALRERIQKGDIRVYKHVHTNFALQTHCHASKDIATFTGNAVLHPDVLQRTEKALRHKLQTLYQMCVIFLLGCLLGCLLLYVKWTGGEMTGPVLLTTSALPVIWPLYNFTP